MALAANTAWCHCPSVTAVELVPGVKESFGYFFEDAPLLLRRPNGKIVIDYGRRYLTLPHMMDAQWDFLEMGMTHLAADYP